MLDAGMPGMPHGMMGMRPPGMGGMPGMGMRGGPMPPPGEPPESSGQGADLDSILTRQSRRDKEKTEKYVPQNIGQYFLGLFQALNVHILVWY